jgi:hypothetical protein
VSHFVVVVVGMHNAERNTCMMKTAQASNRKPGAGHLAIRTHGDDGKVHFTAYRTTGKAAITLGHYSIDAAELLQLVQYAVESPEKGVRNS